MQRRPTRNLILDLAQELAQTRGYNGFSFHDVADKLGIRAASIHHHFPTKADLGEALMVRYRSALAASLARIDEQFKSARKKLERYVQLYQTMLRNGNRFCLCAMFACELTTLPAPIQREVRAFFEDSEAWIARVLLQGRKAGSLDFDGPPAAAARALYGALQGSMLSARTFEDPTRLAAAARLLLDALIPPVMDALLPPG